MLRRTIEHVPVETDPIPIVEKACSRNGLKQTLLTTLKSYPGSTHWHYKKGTARGTLEITWWPKKRNLWLSSRVGRDADWIPEMMVALETEIREQCGIQ